MSRAREAAKATCSTRDEKRTLCAVAVDEINGAVPVVAAGVGLGGSTVALRDLARAAAATRVQAVQILGPRPGPLPMRLDELDAYYRTMIEGLPCDVHLACNRVLSGSTVPVDIVRALVADYPQVKVVNVTEPDLDVLLESVGALAPDVEVRIGLTRHLAEAEARGASGLLSFEANVAPEVVVQACATGELDGLLTLNAALAKGGNPRSLKAALALLGRDGGALRPPYLPLSPHQTAELARDLGL